MSIDFDKTCFVIMPFGKEDTTEREQFDDIYLNIIKRAVEESDLDLECVRVDEITKSGYIIDDIIEYISKSKFVICDLTGKNPNVFYELGIRHSLKDRTIMIAQSKSDLPFDVLPLRTIIYSKNTIENAKKAKEKIILFLKEMNKDNIKNDSPVHRALNNDVNTIKSLSLNTKESKSRASNIIRSVTLIDNNKEILIPRSEEEFIDKINSLRYFHGFTMENLIDTQFINYSVFKGNDPTLNDEQTPNSTIFDMYNDNLFNILHLDYTSINDWPTFYTNYCRFVEHLSTLELTNIKKINFFFPIYEISIRNEKLYKNLEFHFQKKFHPINELFDFSEKYVFSRNKGTLSFKFWDIEKVQELEKENNLTH